jgi:RHS repeat-associated protein
VVKETNATTGNITDYLYGDDLIKQTKAANDSYYLYDGLGSTRALSDSTGTITDTYNYESFGTVLNQTGTTPNDYLFTGEQYDSGLDNYYLRARYYDQNIGRFTQQDTWMGNNSDPITLHKYLYANADPVNNIDPSGNVTIGSLMTAVSNVARLAKTASVNVIRSVAGRVNGTNVRAVTSLRVRLWLNRSVPQVQSKLPAKIFGKGKLSKNKKGWRWGDSKNNVRVQRGNLKASQQSMRQDYVQIRVEGKGIIGRSGKKISTKFSDEAHIPLSEWRGWARWDSPL